MHERPATLNDVAAKAGVSTATVSRCLNSPDKVSKITRDRVLHAVNILGYAPNYAAQAMAAGRTHTIGAVIPTMTNAIFAEGLDAFQKTLGAQGYTLLVATSNYDPKQEEAQIRTLVARGAEALLLIGHARADHVRRFLHTRNMPVVTAWAHDPNGKTPAVGFDNAQAMEHVVDHLYALGHRRLAMITAPKAGNDRVQDRVRGIYRAAQRLGLDAEDIPHETAPYDMD
ncbi:MAG: LacI family DNA-binding transcriptional regulator, partial [Pseudomonadota bacterium]